MTTNDKLDEIFAPIQAEYDGGEPMMPGTIPESKAALRQLIREAREEALRDGFEAAKRLKDYADVVEEARLRELEGGE